MSRPASGMPAQNARGVRLVLASASPRRAEILRQLGFEPEVRAAHVDESHVPGESPAEHVERLARRKAEAVVREVPDALVVGGDTIVLDGGLVLGKPKSDEDALAMLLSLAGREHTVLSGVALAGPAGTFSAISRTEVRFKAFDEEVARKYVATGEPRDKAGAYGIQGLGASLVDSVSGDYYAVVGFPVGAFISLLARAGWRYDFGSLRPLD